MYNLLLVDDEPLIKVAFQSAVEWGKNGFLLAATASNGQEALHIVEAQHIDAVITDLKMPGIPMRMTPENATKKEPNKKPDSISSPSSCGCSAISHHSGFSPFTDAKTLSSASSIACTQIPPVLNIGYTPIIFLLTPVRLLLPAPVGTSPTAIFPFQPVLMPIGKLPAAHRADL